jgi:uncharacterized RDD family membrane protein YckC
MSFPSESTQRHEVQADASHTRAGDAGHRAGTAAELSAASATRRLTAAVIDIAILGSINMLVIYLTLALTGLATDQISIIPAGPLATFLVLLDGAYLVAFVAAGGQTIGKMTVGIRVVTEEGGRVAMSSAVTRAVGCGLSLLTAGLGYLPAFLTAEGRALQDRVSGTRVVSAR